MASPARNPNMQIPPSQALLRLHAPSTRTRTVREPSEKQRRRANRRRAIKSSPLFEFAAPLNQSRHNALGRFAGTAFNNEKLSPEQEKMRTEIKQMESTLNALHTNLLKKREEARKLKLENKKKSMGTISCLETLLNGTFLMGSQQKDLFTSILYILKDFDTRIRKIETCSHSQLPRTPPPTDEDVDNDLFERLRKLEAEENDSHLKQPKITEFINNFPNDLENVVQSTPPPPTSPPPASSPSPLATQNGWDVDCNWPDDGIQFVDFDTNDTRVKDQPIYHCK